LFKGTEEQTEKTDERRNRETDEGVGEANPFSVCPLIGSSVFLFKHRARGVAGMLFSQVALYAFSSNITRDRPSTELVNVQPSVYIRRSPLKFGIAVGIEPKRKVGTATGIGETE